MMGLIPIGLYERKNKAISLSHARPGMLLLFCPIEDRLRAVHDFEIRRHSEQ